MNMKHYLMALAALFAAESAAQGMIVSVRQQTFEEKIREADLVYHVQIESIAEHFFIEDDMEQMCGANYAVTIIEAFKGTGGELLSFSVDASPLPFAIEPLKPGDDLLVLVSHVDGNAIEASEPAGDIETVATAESRSECLRRLSPVRLSASNESAFVLERRTEGGESPDGLWLRYMRSRTAMPDEPDLKNQRYREDCLTSSCAKSVFHIVKWAVLRTLIRSWVRDCDRQVEISIQR